MTQPESNAAATFDLERMFAPTQAVEATMQGYITQRPLPTNLRKAAEYSLLGPGKRLRPILVIRACQAVGGSIDHALPPAAAIEMVHCFSLIHDDLPAMDNDDLRRGRPTLHKATSDAMAILAGDLLNTMAFELLVQKLPADKAVSIIRELALATNDMIAGQVYDTLPDFPEHWSPMQRLQAIHHHKTGALIRCACRMGALAAPQTTEAQLQAISDYASAIGLMFQVVDDLLDVTQSTQQLGKTAGKDVAQHKLTYPALIGIQATRSEITRLHEQALQAIEPLGPRAADLRDLCNFMAVRSK